MTGFELSPGITPFIADLAVAGTAAAMALGHLIDRRWGLVGGLALAVTALGVAKFATDYLDYWDDLVSLGGLLVGLTALATLAGWPRLSVLPGPVWRVFGGLAVLVGGYKVAHDFLDPFDLQLALLLGAFGLWIVLAVAPFDGFRRPPAAARAGGGSRPGPPGSRGDERRVSPA